jgi:acyl carrier protein
MEKNKIEEIVISQVREVVSTIEGSEVFCIDANTVLFGSGSNIDSLSLVSVIVDLETLFFEEYGFEISLTDDRAMTREINPFDNVSNLVGYILEVIDDLKM